MTDAEFIYRIAKRKPREIETMALCDITYVVKMVMDGDLRHVDDEDFRKEMVEAYDASV